MTKRALSGDQTPSDRRHFAVSMDFTVRSRLKEAAAAHGWSMGDLALAMAAEHGPTVTAAREGLREIRRLDRPNPTVVVGLYMTPDEVTELDEVAEICGLPRSVLVETTVRLGLGDDRDTVLQLLS